VDTRKLYGKEGFRTLMTLCRNKAHRRYLEFCNLKPNHLECCKFSYDYKKHLMTVEIENHDKRLVEFDIYDFVDWDRKNYPNNPSFES
jgi:hypothetical protein